MNPKNKFFKTKNKNKNFNYFKNLNKVKQNNSNMINNL